MRFKWCLCLGWFLALMMLTGSVSAVTLFVSKDNSTSVAPYTNWLTAASNIQDAVDAAQDGDFVWVTNGIYDIGGRTVYGSSSNRVVVNKAITIQSVNGPESTAIKGFQIPATTNGDGAVRCIYLTNNAALVGFTLSSGGTATNSTLSLEACGGGAYCETTNAILSNCVLRGNSGIFGGAAYSGLLLNCALQENTAVQGGGAYSSFLRDCLVTNNYAITNGGGAYNGTLVHCEITSNRSGNNGGGTYYANGFECNFIGNTATYGGGAFNGSLTRCTLLHNYAEFAGGFCGAKERSSKLGALTNCLVALNKATVYGGVWQGYLNQTTIVQNEAQYDGSMNFAFLFNCIVYYNKPLVFPRNDRNVMVNCCTEQWPNTSSGCFTNPPMLAGVYHLSAQSPCRNTGLINYATGLDLDGKPWNSPPSIGCDELRLGEDIGPLQVNVFASQSKVVVGFQVSLHVEDRGRISSGYWTFGDGTWLTNTPVAVHSWAAPGVYPISYTACNSSYPGGISATTWVQVAEQPICFVSASSINPIPPYSSWETAAQTIQDAIESVEFAGTLVLVTNGLYNTGGKAVNGLLTNRIALTKPITVSSVNGPDFTTIQGYQLPIFTNGNGAVRCAYLTNGASLSGFTLRNGATRNTGTTLELCGGAVYCESTNAEIVNCVMLCNASSANAGGAYSGTLIRCQVKQNWAGGSGGGASGSSIFNSFLANNTAREAGGVYGGQLSQCNVVFNNANTFGGTLNCIANNCIIYFNQPGTGGNYYPGDYLTNCCTYPMPPSDQGTGNIELNPLLANTGHLTAASPCRNAGKIVSTSGADIDNEPWNATPSIGCDEFFVGAITGTMNATFTMDYYYSGTGNVVTLASDIVGRASGFRWDFGDGVALTNQLMALHTWMTAGTYAVVLTAWSDSFPSGVSVTSLVQVVDRTVQYVSQASTNPQAPFTSWAAAATDMQSAIDAASPGGVIWVNNGVYRTGGRPVADHMTNRAAITKPLFVSSISGPEVTTIEGYQVPGQIFGSNAVRGVYMVSGSTLSGFTITNGGTFNNGNTTEARGGGIYCVSTNSVVTNCIIVGNRANWDGGGANNAWLINCIIKGNYSANSGGGLAGGWAINSLLLRNTGNCDGGGGFNASLTNCTLAFNSVPFYGGGYYGGNARNCLLYSNTGSLFTSNFPYDPVFVAPAQDNFRLQSNSPCINAGSNDFVVTSSDFDVRPRIVNGVVDLGAFEYQGMQTTALMDWLRSHNLPLSASSDDVDADGDGLSNRQEWLADTCPTNRNSTFRADIDFHLGLESFVTFSFTGSTNRLYSLYYTTNLSAPNWHFVAGQETVQGSGGSQSVKDTNSSSIRFYRLEVTMP